MQPAAMEALGAADPPAPSSTNVLWSMHKQDIADLDASMKKWLEATADFIPADAVPEPCTQERDEVLQCYRSAADGDVTACADAVKAYCLCADSMKRRWASLSYAKQKKRLEEEQRQREEAQGSKS
eukprot:TRINITY_DN11385_c0_g1_i2.p2 TRINITY_DN11385_c0_g1~~TRINITY_DN11385_c0_g1_i2.p2  ORF type:complete len:126 (+),score=55.53 TRINITY_DN11385_c0_g1_i2:121-498(+)